MKIADMAVAPEQYCRLLRPIKDHLGRTRFNERPIILRHVRNLDRSMYLVRFSDGATTFLFPDEVALENASFTEATEESAGHSQNVLH
jgi:hypothetical protein